MMLILICFYRIGYSSLFTIFQDSEVEEQLWQKFGFVPRKCKQRPQNINCLQKIFNLEILLKLKAYPTLYLPFLRRYYFLKAIELFFLPTR